MKTTRTARRTSACWLILLAILSALALLAPAGASAQELKVFQSATPPPGAVWLDSFDLSRIDQAFGRPGMGRSVLGLPIKLKGQVYPHGVGSHAASMIELALGGAAVRFAAMVGVDDEATTNGSVTFEIWVDGVKKLDSGLLRGGDAPKLLAVDLKGAKNLKLYLTEGGNFENSWDHGDWAGAFLELAPGATFRPKPLVIEDVSVPPMASGTSPKPAIHGPRIVGATPGRPFLYLIPATGQGPLMFAAKNLPEGLMLDEKTGIISGRLKKAGETLVKLQVRGAQGKARRTLKIVGGEHKLALTPPMGWNSWYSLATLVDAASVRLAADWLVKSGLAAHGYNYVNIDDGWEGGRDSLGRIQTNAKFGDMKALADHVHSLGLKFGIYSSPGPQTCGNFEGSYAHEALDIRSYADWGVDFLKYDWCSYGNYCKNNSVEELAKPYLQVSEELDKCSRDMVYSLCQYGMGNVWEWGAQKVHANLWRTTSDMLNQWTRMSNFGFDLNGPLGKYAGPGHWNDPDMLIVGMIGVGPNPAPTRLWPSEQLTYMSMWCMAASPLIISNRMDHLDKFTLDLLTNDEVLDVNQDSLGVQARRIVQKDNLEVWVKPLWDGTQAVGLFNRSLDRKTMTVEWAALGLKGAQPVRDLWQHKDLGKSKGSFSALVPPHGVVLIKVGKPQRTEIE